MQILPKINLLITLVLGLFSLEALASNQPDQYKIINLADDFYSVYQSSQNLSQEKRAEFFSEYFTSEFSPFYSNKNFDKSIANFSEIQEVYLLKNKLLSKNLNNSMEAFITTFSDFKPKTPIYILHSLGGFNGAKRNLDGKSYLIYGVDLIAKYHTWKNDTPFFHHELFHVYHEDFFQCNDELWCLLWMEGLATYVSHELNSSANNDELMLNIPKNMIKDVHSNILFSLKDLETKFYSKEPEIFASFFSFKKDETGLPYRRGYYLGYILAQEIGKNYNIKELAKMTKSEIEVLLLKALNSFIEREAQKSAQKEKQ